MSHIEATARYIARWIGPAPSAAREFIAAAVAENRLGSISDRAANVAAWRLLCYMESRRIRRLDDVGVARTTQSLKRWQNVSRALAGPSLDERQTAVELVRLDAASLMAYEKTQDNRCPRASLED